MAGEVRQQALRQPVDAAGQCAMDKTDMAAVRQQFQRHAVRQMLAARYCRRRQKWVVRRVQQQRRGMHRAQERPGAAPRVIVVDAIKSVQRRGDGIVEIPQGARGPRAANVDPESGQRNVVFFGPRFYTRDQLGKRLGHPGR